MTRILIAYDTAEGHEFEINGVRHGDPEEFDAGAVTKRMRRGLPDWKQHL